MVSHTLEKSGIFTTTSQPAPHFDVAGGCGGPFAGAGCVGARAPQPDQASQPLPQRARKVCSFCIGPQGVYVFPGAKD